MRRTLVWLAAGLILSPLFALGQTMELKRRWVGKPVTRPVPVKPQQIALKYLGVETTVQDQVATTQIDQTFHNPNNWQAEGTYLFPLPEGTSVSNFTMYMGGKEVKGEVLDRDKASQIYESIVRKRQDPGLLEFIGHRLIRARVFPIPAKGDVRIKIAFTRVLKADSGWFEYDYPLSSVGNRIGEASFKVTLKSQTPIKTVYSPSHQVHVARKSDREVVVRYEKRGLAAEKSLRLLYGLSEKALGMHLLTHRRKGDEGYMMLAISPKVEIDETEVIGKSIIFVVDTSGSMAGEKMEQAKKALAYCVNKLGAKSSFNVVRFSTEVEALDEDKLLAVSKDSRKEALEFIEDLDAAGGTNIDEALEMALELAGKRDGLTEIVFLTDGKPTIGERTAKNILANVKTANKSRARLFVFGVGTDLNTHLLDKLAEANRGMRMYVTEGESIERKVSSFYNKISSPVLTDLKLDLGNLRVKHMFPKQLPDLFVGTQLLVLARYTGEGAEPITLTGTVNGKKKEFVFEATFAAETKRNTFLPRLWAQRKVGNLLDQIRLHGESEELRKEVVALAKQYGIVTPYTSALVLEDGARQLDRVQRLGWKGGRAGAGQGGAGRGPVGRPAKPGDVAPDPKNALAPKAREREERKAGAEQLKAESGKRAVELSKQLKRLKESNQADESDNDDARADKKDHGTAGEPGRDQQQRQRGMRKVADKTFVLAADGFMVETTLIGKKDRLEKATKIGWMSKEYFELVKANPQLGQYLKVGKKVIFDFGGKVYRIE